jgi:hypothetical protein
MSNLDPTEHESQNHDNGLIAQQLNQFIHDYDNLDDFLPALMQLMCQQTNAVATVLLLPAEEGVQVAGSITPFGDLDSAMVANEINHHQELLEAIAQAHADRQQLLVLQKDAMAPAEQELLAPTDQEVKAGDEREDPLPVSLDDNLSNGSQPSANGSDNSLAKLYAAHLAAKSAAKAASESQASAGEATEVLDPEEPNEATNEVDVAINEDETGELIEIEHEGGSIGNDIEHDTQEEYGYDYDEAGDDDTVQEDSSASSQGAPWESETRFPADTADLLQNYSAIYTPLCCDPEVNGMVVNFYSTSFNNWLQTVGQILFLIADRSEAWRDKRELAQSENARRSLEQEWESLQRIGQNVDRKKFCYDLVNELKQIFDCDRVSFLTHQSGSCKAIAFSGQPVFDKRSNTVRRLTKLVKIALQSRRPFWSNDQDIAPQLEKPLDAYCEESHTRSLAILPIIITPAATNPTYKDRMIEMVNEGNPNNQKIIGALVLEQIEHPLDRELIEQKWQRLEAPIVNAANNSSRFHSLFLMPVWLLLGQFFSLYVGSTKKKAVAVTAAIAVAVAALLLIPAELTIRCEGIVQPKELQHIYAQEQGSVEGILVTDGQHVEAGQVLLEQRNLQLQEELVRISGELKRLEVEKKNLLRRMVASRTVNDESGREGAKEEITSQLAEIQAGIRIQQQMVALYEQRMQELKIQANFAGTVFAWNAKRRFSDRPVSAGDKLFSVANTEGPWEIDLKVADKRAGYVMRAWHKHQQQEGPALQVTYVRTSEPNRRFQGTVIHVPENHEVGGNGESILPIKVSISQADIAGSKPGSTVVAQIHCGRGSLGYTKTYEFFDWLQRKWFELFY